MGLVNCKNNGAETWWDDAYEVEDTEDDPKVGASCGETGACGYGHCVADEQEGDFDALS